MSPLHKTFGISIDEWIDRIPNELEVDGVGLHQIVPVFAHDFGLSGAELQYYVARAVRALVARGAVPVAFPGGGPVRADLMGPHGPNAEKICAYIQTLNREATVDDIWFELPSAS